MAGAYYKPCKEFDICNELIENIGKQNNMTNALKVIWYWRSRAIPLLNVK